MLVLTRCCVCEKLVFNFGRGLPEPPAFIVRQCPFPCTGCLAGMFPLERQWPS